MAFVGVARRAAALLVGAALLCAGSAAALDPARRFHHYDLRRWDLADGHPLATITALAQDRRGYLWVGTQGGLYRFDGQRFVAYRAGAVPELGSDAITALAVDAGGALWIGSATGLTRYADGEFSAIAPSDPLVREVTALLAGPDDALLVAGPGGLQRVVAGRREAIGGPAALRPLHALVRDGEAVWAAADDGLVRLVSDAATFDAMTHPSGGAAPTLQARALAVVGGELWIGTPRGLLRRDGARLRPLEALGARPVEALLPDADGNLWVASNAGLYRVRDGALHERIEDEGVLHNLWNRALFEDDAGQLWIGAQSGGLVRIGRGRAHLIGRRDGLQSETIWAVAMARDGGAWIGTADGVAHYGPGERARVAIRGAALPGPVVPALLEDSDGRLWIGSTRGLAVWQGGRPLALPAQPPGRYLAIIEDRAGTIWIGSEHGLQTWSARDPRFVHVPALRGKRVRHLAEADGTVWVATEDGTYTVRDGAVDAIDADLELPARYALLVRHTAGATWVGYLDQGLLRVAGARRDRFTIEQGLPANTILFVHGADDGYLWLSTLQGVARIPLADFDEVAAGRRARLRVEHVVKQDATRPATQVSMCCHGGSTGAGAVRADGALLLPTSNGVVVLEPEPASPAGPPLPRIERVETARRRVLDPGPGALALDADERDVTVEFSAPALRDLGQPRFEYRLDGRDEAWTDAEDRRVAIYTNLGAGAYALRVRSVDRAGRAAAAEAAVAFEIAPRLDERAWARGLAALLLLLAGYGAHRYRNQRLLHRQAELERQVAERTRELSSANARLERVNRHLEELTLTDELTGVRNRRFIETVISKEVAQLRRHNQRAPQPHTLLLALVDFDHFKRINDTWGHDVGDAVLREGAELLQRFTRAGDHVIRFGGEEFLLVMHGADRAGAQQAAERICTLLRDHRYSAVEGAPVRMSASVGCAIFPFLAAAPEALELDAVLKLADRALYHVKQHGRDGWALAYAPATPDPAALMAALDRDAATLAARGLIDLSSSAKPLV